MSDATLKCPVCGASLPARAKFCGECGAPMKAAGPAPRAAGAPSPVLPWFLAGCAVLAVQTAVLIVALRRGPAPQPIPASTPAPAGSAPSGSAPDISNLTPREAADRLFERVARASSAGDTGQVAFFAPMALNAYANVSPLDPDARLHMALIALAMGDAPRAAAQGDSIVRFAPTHLFGPVVRARVAEARGDAAGRREANRAFLANYDAERAKNLPEYDQHRDLLTEVLTDARRGGSR